MRERGALPRQARSRRGEDDCRGDPRPGRVAAARHECGRAHRRLARGAADVENRADGAQLRREGRRRVVTRLEALGQRVRDDRVDLRRKRSIDRARRGRRRLDDLQRQRAVGVAPVNVSLPVSISNSTMPSEKMSVRRSTASPSACSGDMYATVPSVVSGLVASIVVAASRSMPPAVHVARPKSRILAAPFGVTMMFEGLMSRWTIPSACASARPSAICAARSTARRGFIGRPAIARFSVSPGTNSKTRNSAPWSSPIS